MTGLLVCTTPAWVLPTGEQIMAGQVSVNVPDTHQMKIQQTSQKAIINWQGMKRNTMTNLKTFMRLC